MYFLHEVSLKVLQCPQPSAVVIGAYVLGTNLLPWLLPQPVKEKQNNISGSDLVYSKIKL